MAKMEQALILDPPAELHFRAPFTDVTTSYLNLTNPTNRQICFKVKTTAPKTYCVRPNSGVVPPRETVAVQVMLQPLDLLTADRSKHKFMVQSMFAPDGEFNADNLWKDVPPDGLMNSKLKCVFDIPSDPSLANAPIVDPPKHETKVAEVQEIPSKNFDASSELKKLQEEHKKLKNELNTVRQENSSLKEEGLRSRVTHESRSKGTSANPAEFESRASPEKQQLGIPTSYIVISVFIFIFGLYLGKQL